MTDNMNQIDWPWWAGTGGEFFSVGPCKSREDVIANAVLNGIGLQKDGGLNFVIVQASQDPILLSDWVDAEGVLDMAENLIFDDRVSSEFDSSPIFDCTQEQEADLNARIKSTISAWQRDHGLVFGASTFSGMTGSENVVMSKEEAELWRSSHKDPSHLKP